MNTGRKIFWRGVTVMREEWFGREVTASLELSPIAWRDSIAMLAKEVQSLLPAGGLLIIDADRVNQATWLSLLSGLHHALPRQGVSSALKTSLIGRPELLTGSAQVIIVPFPGSIFGLQGTGLPDGKVVVIPASSAAYERLALAEPVTVPALPTAAAGEQPGRYDTSQLKKALAAVPPLTRQIFLAAALFDTVAAPLTYRLLADTFNISEDDLEDIILASGGLLHISESSDVTPLLVTVPHRDEALALLSRVPLTKRQNMYSKVLRHIDWQSATERQIALHLPAGLLEKGERRLGISLLKELQAKKVWQAAKPAELVSWSRMFSSYRLYSVSQAVLDYSLKQFPASRDLWHAKLDIVSSWVSSKPDMAALAHAVYRTITELWPDDDKAKLIRAKLEMATGSLDKAKDLLRTVREKALPNSSSPLWEALQFASRSGWIFPGLIFGGPVGLVAAAVAFNNVRKNAFAAPKEERKADYQTLTQWRTQADIAKGRGDTKNAAQWYTALLDHGHTTIQSSVALAEIALQEGNLKKVLDYTGRVLAKDAENPDALWVSAQALVALAQGRKQEEYRKQAELQLALLTEVDPEREEANNLYRQVKEQTDKKK